MYLAIGGLSEEEALRAALATWPKGVRPVVHWSESQVHMPWTTESRSRSSRFFVTQNNSMIRRGYDMDCLGFGKGRGSIIRPVCAAQGVETVSKSGASVCGPQLLFRPFP